MPITKVGPKHQVTIPKEVFDSLKLEVGDFLKTTTHKGRIIMEPKQLVYKAPAPALTKREQELAPLVQKKIKKIQTNMIDSQGLTSKEAKLAGKLGIIDPDQEWWWKEYWQKGEREVEEEIKAGGVKSFNSIEALMTDLNS